MTCKKRSFEILKCSVKNIRLSEGWEVIRVTREIITFTKRLTNEILASAFSGMGCSQAPYLISECFRIWLQIRRDIHYFLLLPPYCFIQRVAIPWSFIARNYFTNVWIVCRNRVCCLKGQSQEIFHLRFFFYWTTLSGVLIHQQKYFQILFQIRRVIRI